MPIRRVRRCRYLLFYASIGPNCRALVPGPHLIEAFVFDQCPVTVDRLQFRRIFAREPRSLKNLRFGWFIFRIVVLKDHVQATATRQQQRNRENRYQYRLLHTIYSGRPKFRPLIVSLTETPVRSGNHAYKMPINRLK